MTIEFRCAQCNQLLRVPDTSAGKNARCPKCQTLMQIPGGASAPPSGSAYVPPPPPPSFVPPPPPPPLGYGPPGPPPNPFDFAGGPSTSIPSGSSAKKGSFDFLGGAPAPSSNPHPLNPPPPPGPPAVPYSKVVSGGPPSPYGVPPPPYGAPPPPGGGGFLVNAGGPVNPYASPSSSAGGYYDQAPGTKGRPGLPWEKKPHKKGMLTAFTDTAKLVAFEPGKAFSQMQQRGDMGGPMLYSGLGMVIGISVFFLWLALILTLMGAAAGARAEYYGIMLLGLLLYAGLIIFISVPMSATIGNFIAGGILHVCLMICGGSKQPFDTSFRIQCYISGSLMLAMVFPPALLFLGIWQIVCAIIAVHKAHEVPMGRAAMAVLLPIIVIVVLNVIVSLLFMASLGAALSR